MRLDQQALRREVGAEDLALAEEVVEVGVRPFCCADVQKKEVVDYRSGSADRM